jgi:DNA-binding response OmpR family regulator
MALPNSLMLCIEDPLYRLYLEEELTERGVPFTSVARGTLSQTVVENHQGVLILQTETDEPEAIEFVGRVKRLFSEEFVVILLSADSRTEEEAGNSVDGFLQYPTSWDTIQAVISRLKDSNRTILLIDDSKLVHNHVVPPLKEAGYRVLQAFDGAEGLRIAQEAKPDLIICDIEMPKLNGFEVCTEIRKTETLAECYIIMSSTLGSAADQQRGFHAGVDEYLQKPVVIPELLDRIKKVFTRTRGGRERILILDREELSVRNATKSLTKQGFSTRVATNLLEARRLLKRASFDLVLAEIDPMGGTVLDLIALLKSLPAEKQPDLLILASRNSQADNRMVLNAGASGVISKPFTADSLLASVERTLADRRATQEKAHLQKYVSKASLRMALEKSVLAGKTMQARAYRRKATVFFSDIVGFTTRCETYPPQEVVAQVNRLFESMTRVIIEHQGDIDKFIGDACMAFWMEDDIAVSSERALRAVLEMGPQIEALNASNPTLQNDPIQIRVGINSGEVILCDLGAAEARMDLTIIGDTVNVAARFESAGKQYGIRILVGESTIKPVEHLFTARLIDWVRVKGKHLPVGCYELIESRDRTTPKQLQLVAEFSEGMRHYQAGNFTEALRRFEATDLLEAVTDPGAINPSRLYLKRCQQLLHSPPDQWDGVWTLTSK